MKACELVRSLDVANSLGEGVLWNPRTQTAWWTDIEGRRLFEYDEAADDLRSWATPHRLASFGFIDGDDSLVVAFDRGIAIYSVDAGIVEWLVSADVLPPGIRFNDGKVDAQGRFWAGTMVEDRSVPRGSGALYSYAPGAGLVEHVGNVTISNGLCWSPDSRVMYHADSPRNSILAYPFDPASGRVQEPRVFVRTPRDAYPDGSTVDAEGGVWNAQWGAGQVVRYDADGRTDLVVKVPASQPTCVAFGGADLNLLFVTSARQGLRPAVLESEPQAGNLFVYRTDFQGLPAFAFRRQ